MELSRILCKLWGITPPHTFAYSTYPLPSRATPTSTHTLSSTKFLFSNLYHSRRSLLSYWFCYSHSLHSIFYHFNITNPPSSSSYSHISNHPPHNLLTLFTSMCSLFLPRLPTTTLSTTSPRSSSRGFQPPPHPLGWHCQLSNSRKTDSSSFPIFLHLPQRWTTHLWKTQSTQFHLYRYFF
jgi:hypothetical protein